MESIHQGKVAKRAFERMWDTLSNRDRDIIAADVDRQTELAKWFYATVAQTAKSRYESATYWMNDIESFKRSKHAQA
jgi:hypothetical protein